MTFWITAFPIVGAAFLGSLVEAVEAFTIVLAASLLGGWRPALAGVAAGMGVLALLVAILGPALDTVPLDALQIVIGTLLLLFGMRWLRKAILRAAGAIALHDEALAYRNQSRQLAARASRVATAAARVHWLAGMTAFKAVLLEGLEVVFIVLAVGAGSHRLLAVASIGAAAACAIVMAVGLVLRRPLARVPENTLKFSVGVVLSAFGVVWTGEGVGVGWPGGDLAIAGLAVLFLLAGLALVRAAKRRARVYPA